MITWVPIIVMSTYMDLYTEKAREEEPEVYFLNYLISVKCSPPSSAC
jgi:hypothetical protein